MYSAQNSNLLQNNIQKEKYSQSPPQPIMTENNYTAAYNQNQQQNQVVYHAIELAQQEGFQSNQSPFIKDLPFQQQKNYLLAILGLFLLWTFTHIFFIYLLRPTFDMYLYRYKYLLLLLLFVGLILMVLFSILGLKKKNRKNSDFYYIANVLSYILTFYTCYQLLYNSELSWRYYEIIHSMIFDSQILNLVATIVMMIFISSLEREFNSLQIIGLVYIFLIPFQYILSRYYLIYNFWFLYTILLVNSLKQILNGRHKLKKDEVLVGAIAALIFILKIYSYCLIQSTIYDLLQIIYGCMN